DSILRGDVQSPELRWRDAEGVHRSQSRPRPSPREQLAPDRFSGLIGQGSSWRTEPSWRGDGGFRGDFRGDYRADPGGRGGSGSGFFPGERGSRPGFRPGASGSWRPGRSPSGSLTAAAGAGAGAPRVEAPFVAGEIADRGPVERGTTPAPEPRAREARELSRQREWRESATKAIDTLKAEEGTGPVNAAELVASELAALEAAARTAELGLRAAPTPGIDDLAADDGALLDGALDDDDDDDDRASGILESEPVGLPTLRLLPQGISRKRLEQAIRELQLPVIIARDVDEADVVMTIRSEYKQKTPMVREAEERAMPIYVLKANTIPQMQASLTSIFALEIDPRDAALRETEEAIGLVINRAEAIELSPQNAYIRRLQHQMAERANLVSRSRGREPYRRVRLYPDAAKSPWR
ncbi:MAG TPA: R3H domain-containing nucleic acid-binding protein, partial [Candidatus Limnocylindrales bacterium]